MPFPFKADSLVRKACRDRFAQKIKEALSSLELDAGCLIPSLGGGFYQLKNVPLEVASNEDRRDQIMWEASQALISKPDEYIIDYCPAGRSAFWIAIRREIRDLLAGLFETAGHPLNGLVITPMALYQACELANLWTSERNAAILLSEPTWLSFVAGNISALSAAETARIPQHGEGQIQDSAAERLEVAKRWIFGDRRRTVYRKIFFCGEPGQIRDVTRILETPSSPVMKPLEPFAGCDTDGLQANQQALLSRQSAFAIAAGLAYQGLKENTS